MKEEFDILSKLKYQKPVSPDIAYFQNMAQKIHVQENKKKNIPIFKRPITYIGISIAASVILVVNLFIKQELPYDSASLAEKLIEVDKDQVVAYIDENIEDFDIDLISEYAEEQDLFISNTSVTNPEIERDLTSTENMEIEINDLDKKEIMDYFLEQGLDLDSPEDYEFI